jgi:hypothetical protein
VPQSDKDSTINSAYECVTAMLYIDEKKKPDEMKPYCPTVLHESFIYYCTLDRPVAPRLLHARTVSLLLLLNTLLLLLKSSHAASVTALHASLVANSRSSSRNANYQQQPLVSAAAAAPLLLSTL